MITLWRPKIIFLSIYMRCWRFLNNEKKYDWEVNIKNDEVVQDKQLYGILFFRFW